MNNRSKLSLLFLAIAAIALIVAAVLLWRGSGPVLPAPLPSATASPSAAPTPPALPDPSALPVMEDDGLPHDKLFITVERQKYQSEELQLVIPKLDVDVPVLNGVDAQTLLQGVGLYDYAQLPGDGDRNVSIAGHRNGLRNGIITDNMPFYYIDTLETGDYLYLTDDEHIYQYDYHSTEVVEPDDWGPIYSQGFSCLTLTSCTPIGVSDHRIIVRGSLTQTLDLSDNYDYPSKREEKLP